MLHTELLHALALLKVDGIGDVVAKKLINHCGSAQDVFQSKKKALLAATLLVFVIYTINFDVVGFNSTPAKKKRILGLS